jgi:hypothetical protein
MICYVNMHNSAVWNTKKILTNVIVCDIIKNVNETLLSGVNSKRRKKMKYYVSNAFSLNMLERVPQIVQFLPCSVEQARQELEGCEIISTIGHADTAAVVSAMLQISLPANRISVKLTPGDGLLVAQLTGPRLPEGATTLPEGASIEFWIVSVIRNDFARRDK